MINTLSPHLSSLFVSNEAWCSAFSEFSKAATKLGENKTLGGSKIKFWNRARVCVQSCQKNQTPTSTFHTP